jgi:hypothetical protein
MDALDLLHAPAVMAILQACQIIDPDSGNLVEAYINELLAARPGWSKEQVLAWVPEMSLPADEAAARQELVEIVRAQIERLEFKLNEHEELAELEDRYSGQLRAFDWSPEGKQIRRYETTCNRYVDRYINELMKRMGSSDVDHYGRSSTDYLRPRAPVFRGPDRPIDSPERYERSHVIESISERERGRAAETEESEAPEISMTACQATTRTEPAVRNEPNASGEMNSPQEEKEQDVTPESKLAGGVRTGRILRNEAKPGVAGPHRGSRQPKVWDNSRRARRARKAIHGASEPLGLGEALNLVGPHARKLLPVELGS